MSIKASRRENRSGTINPGNVSIETLPIVNLDANQIQQALSLAKKRNESYKSIDGGGIFGSQDSLTPHQIGIIGELAMAQLYNVDVDTNTYDWGDNGWDHRLLGATVDVKSTSTDLMQRPELLVSSNSELKADIYVLSHVVDYDSSGAKVRFLGYAPREKVAAREPQEHPGDSMNYVVPPQELEFLPLVSSNLV